MNEAICSPPLVLTDDAFRFTASGAKREDARRALALVESSDGVLFDMDGVLIDSEPVHAKAINALAVELGGCPLEEAVLFGFKGVPDRDVAAGILRLFPESGLTPAEIMARAFALFEERFALVRLLPGAREFASACRKGGKRLALATSAARRMQRMAFEAFELDPFFETLVTAEDVRRGKPDPEPYLLAAARLGLEPGRCVVLEDSLNGVRSGRAAGCRVVALTTTFSASALWEAGAEVVVAGYGG